MPDRATVDGDEHEHRDRRELHQPPDDDRRELVHAGEECERRLAPLSVGNVVVAAAKMQTAMINGRRSP